MDILAVNPAAIIPDVAVAMASTLFGTHDVPLLLGSYEDFQLIQMLSSLESHSTQLSTLHALLTVVVF